MAATLNSPFFGKFPKLKYDINHTQYPVYENVTDIFFRIGYLKDILNNIAAYQTYEVQDGETPDVLAAKFYGDAGAGWMILYANKIYDPQFDWPLSYRQFDNYIKGKYGSIQNAKNQIHHYEKIIVRTNSETKTTTEDRYWVTPRKLTDNTPSVPFNYYYPWHADYVIKESSTDYTEDNTENTVDSGYDEGWKTGSLPTNGYYGGISSNETVSSGFVRTHNVDGATVVETLYREAISCYDYENALNEQKRSIKVIKSQYYGIIMAEFIKLSSEAQGLGEGLAGSYAAAYVRRLT